MHPEKAWQACMLKKCHPQEKENAGLGISTQPQNRSPTCVFSFRRGSFLSMLSTMPFLPSFIPLAVRIQPSKGVRNERAGNRWPSFYEFPRSSLFKTPPTHALSANKLLMMPHKHGPFYEFLGSFLLFNTLPPHLPMPYQQTSCS